MHASLQRFLSASPLFDADQRTGKDLEKKPPWVLRPSQVVDNLAPPSLPGRVFFHVEFGI